MSASDPRRSAVWKGLSGGATQNLLSLRLTSSRNRFVDCGHYRSRGCLVHHVADASQGMEGTSREILMQARRLFIDVNQAVTVARDNDQRHFQARIIASHRDRVGDHQRRLG